MKFISSAKALLSRSDRNEAQSASPMRFIKYSKIFFLISAILVLPGIYSLARYGLRLSIDFTGGSLIELQLPKIEGDQSTVLREIATASGLDVSTVQSSSDATYLLRTKPASTETKDKFITALKEKLTGAEVVDKRFETVGPTVGAELTQKSIIAIAISSALIIVYMAWAFRHIPKEYSPWKFGASAVIALLHDALVVLGLFSLFGHYFQVEIDALFVTAILTVIGFSVHDTIVVFDRVRENLPKMTNSTLEEVMDYSLAETLVRSLNTSFTVLLTLSALLLFGGETIRWFVVALLIGIASGTYSSIFNAAPILVLWEKRK